MKFLKKIIFTIKRYLFTTLVKITVREYGKNLRVNRFSKVSKKTTLGTNVNFNGISIQGCGEVNIGDNFHSGEGCVILTQNHHYEGEMIPYDNTYICKKTVIEDNVWFGLKVIILPGIHIAEGAIVQAGAVVTKNVSACAIVGGNPAIEFKQRDKEHYYRLKEEGKFN